MNNCFTVDMAYRREQIGMLFRYWLRSFGQNAWKNTYIGVRLESLKPVVVLRPRHGNENLPAANLDIMRAVLRVKTVFVFMECGKRRYVVVIHGFSRDTANCARELPAISLRQKIDGQVRK